MHIGADSEWVLYGMDMVTWLLRSVGDGECGSWIAPGVRFVVPRRRCRWAVGGFLQVVTGMQSGMDEGADGCRYRVWSARID